MSIYFHKAGDKTMTSTYDDAVTTFLLLAVEAKLLLPPICQHPPLKGVLKYMAEAIISRRGWTASGKPELRTEIITSNQNWIVPNSLRGNVSVRIFGAGGAGNNGAGGGGGWMNNGEVKVTPGQSIQITVGVGTYKGSGGTTSFGTFLSATGGGYGSGSSGGSGGSGGGSGWSSGRGGRGYQFGGGGGTTSGGDGGIWGGGGAGMEKGGNGGTYGGGGGCYVRQFRNGSFGQWGAYGIGGTYGGNGFGGNTPTSIRRAENGTNTIGNSEVPANCQGAGLSGGTYGGGGGFGGNGGAGYISRYDDGENSWYGGAGGGYGGNGGRYNGTGRTPGGGGYGRGADGNWGGGGGGYFCPGQYLAGGGYSAEYGSGTTTNSGGTTGICILQYYI